MCHPGIENKHTNPVSSTLFQDYGISENRLPVFNIGQLCKINFLMQCLLKDFEK